MRTDQPADGDRWDSAAAIVKALGRIDLRGGHVEWAAHEPTGVDIVMTPPPGSVGSLIFVTAVEDEVLVVAGAGGRVTVNNECEEDIEHFIDIINALIDGGGRDLVSHSATYGFEPSLAIQGKRFSVYADDATFARQIPGW